MTKQRKGRSSPRLRQLAARDREQRRLNPNPPVTCPRCIEVAKAEIAAVMARGGTLDSSTLPSAGTETRTIYSVTHQRSGSRPDRAMCGTPWPLKP